MTKAKKGLKMWFKQQNTFLVSMKPWVQILKLQKKNKKGTDSGIESIYRLYWLDIDDRQIVTLYTLNA
jgi:hypothetical protein